MIQRNVMPYQSKLWPPKIVIRFEVLKALSLSTAALLQRREERMAYCHMLDSAGTNELVRLRDPAFHRDGFSDLIFGWVVFDDLTELG